MVGIGLDSIKSTSISPDLSSLRAGEGYGAQSKLDMVGTGLIERGQVVMGKGEGTAALQTIRKWRVFWLPLVALEGDTTCDIFLFCLIRFGYGFLSNLYGMFL
ncbi:hypothetical protein CRG98_007847 [Punica granatum]|uniref:Uncharacterized protein n=1 Tax=Punica granatum TaxID=22663 RepID=A0A2I0KTA7_PUNGR|nr:hypothetical protein CRG98_007847 [Punica granatum]